MMVRMGWTWSALVFAFVSGCVAIAAAVVAYLGRQREDPDDPGFWLTGKYSKRVFVLTLLAPFFAALSAGFSALAILANE